MYHITIAWAQLEKRQLTERVKAGMERARAEGKSLGRPQRSRLVTQHPQWAKVVSALDAGHINRAEAARKLRVRKSVLIDALASFPNGGADSGGAGAESPFPKDILWERSWDPVLSAVPATLTLFVFIVVGSGRVSEWSHLSGFRRGECVSSQEVDVLEAKR